MAEVVVVGSGIVGLGVAYELARRGARVTVLDARAAGLGATQASAGVLAPYIEAPGETALHELAVESLGLYDEFVARIVRTARMDVDYQRTGTIDVALDVDEASRLRATAKVLEAKGVEAEMLEGAAIFRKEPSLAPAAEAALLVPGHGFVSAPALIRALVRATVSLGVTHRSGTRIIRVSRQGDRLSVATDADTFPADVVIVAAGSWSGQIDTGAAFAPPVRPVRGQLLHLAWNTTPLTRVVWGARCYMVPWADGTVLVGATVEEAGFAEDVTVAGVQTLLSAACELVPQTLAARFREARVGLRPATPDTLPVIGPSPEMPGLFYATGHYRSGVLLTPITAAILADGILEGRWHRLLDAISPDRFVKPNVFRAEA